MTIRAVYAGAVAHAGLLFAEVTERTLITSRDITTTRWTALAKRTLKSALAEEISPLIHATVTVVIFTVTGLFWLISTITTAVARPLIDRAVAVIVFTITGLGDEPSRRQAHDFTRLTALRDASSASPNELSVARVRRYDR